MSLLQHGPIARLTAVGGLLLLATAPLLAGAVLYVDDDAPFGGDGQSWQTAFRFLEDALAAAQPGSDVEEVRVAQGTYLPDRDEAHPEGTGDREATFQLIDDVSLMGGYAGIGAEDPDARDIDLYETILSGDLARNDGRRFRGNEENSFHVVTGSGCDATAVLDGFTITAGHAIGPSSDGSGGGMRNQQGSPTVSRCTFRQNEAVGWGGGMFNESHGNPMVSDCTFADNLAFAGAGMANRDYSDPMVSDCTFQQNTADIWGGGGVYNFNDSSPILANCRFVENSTGNVGGGMFSTGGAPTLTNCTFDGNTAEAGGGLYNHTGTPTITTCTFTANHADQVGGGMGNNYCSPAIIGCTFSENWAFTEGGGVRNTSSAVTIANSVFLENSALHEGGGMHTHLGSAAVTGCVFLGNSASDGGGLFNSASDMVVTNCTFSANSASTDGGAIANETGDPVITNSILWGDAGGEIYSPFGNPFITYCDVQGGYEGEGNIDADPLFADPDGPDNDPDTWEDNDFRLSAGSPCIDAGDNTAVPEGITTDLDGNPRFVDDPDTEDTGHGEPPIVDMGAYEFQPPECPADFNGDGVVNTADLLILLGAWGTSGPDGDVDGDGDVDTADLLALLGAWGECP